MTPADHLDALARALAAAGWSSRPRYDSIPALLHVLSPNCSVLGESVRVKPGVGGVPWFIGSTGDPLAPCHDPAGTVAQIAARLGSFAAPARPRTAHSHRRMAEQVVAGPAVTRAPRSRGGGARSP